MSKKLLCIVIALLVIIIAGGAFFFLNNKAPGDGNQAMPSASVSETPANLNLSEQPNQAKFDEFFTAVWLAKLPVGAKFDPAKIKKTTAFSVGEQFCTSFNMKKQIPADTLTSAVYDTVAKKDVQPRGVAFPQALGPGNSIGCESLAQGVGQYEFKMYLGDVLVSVIPFEVK